MFDIGWSELLILAMVAIIVVGPKDLPKLMGTVGRYVGRIRAMANEFRQQFDEAIRESELQSVRDSVDEIRKIEPFRDVEDSIKSIKNDVEAPHREGGADSAASTPAEESSSAVDETNGGAVENGTSNADEKAEAGAVSNS